MKAPRGSISSGGTAGAVRSRLAPMIAVAGMLKRRFENIITYLKHRIHQRGQRIHQRQDSMGEVHSSRLSQQTELHQRHLLPLWRAGPRPISH
jgi:hypothetical protein